MCCNPLRRVVVCCGCKVLNIGHMLYRVELCCVAMCGVVLCCVVGLGLCCAVSCCAVLRCVVVCCVELPCVYVLSPVSCCDVLF